jgi:predicted choloylglycine hydrolase
MENGQELHGRFKVMALEGDSRGIGRQMARFALSANPESATALRAKTGPVPDAILRSFDEACPGVVEEQEGFAEGLGIPRGETAFLACSALKGANCSQAAVRPRAASSGHCLVMRSYEWRPDEDDLTLCVTRKAGRYAHLGCSVWGSGRMDGMNERGLSVTMSGGMAAGLPNEWHYRDGLNFWVVIRGMLENCADAREALDFLSAHVSAGNHIFILADPSGAMVLAEIGHGKLYARPAAEGEDFLVATNHFVQAEPAALNKIDFIMKGSPLRKSNLEAALREAGHSVDEELLAKLLTAKVPLGCFGPWYSQGFGTLWASIFDLEARKATYWFGAPRANPPRVFGMDEAKGLREYDAIFPEEAE